MVDLLLSEQQAPPPWRQVGPRRPPAGAADWRDAVGGLGAGEVRVAGGEPLAMPDLHALLAALHHQGRRVTLHTCLPGLDDDLQVRPFSAWDVRFRVTLPAADAAGFEALTGAPLEPVLAGLRNLEAFGFPYEIEVPLAATTLAGLADTVARAHAELGARSVRLRPVEPVDAALAHGVGQALLDLEARALRPHLRLVLDGLPALALPVDALEEVDVRTDDPADAPAPGWLQDVDARARRRVWLMTPAQDRPGHRGHSLDRLGRPTSLVLLREGHEVYAVVDRVADARPLLARAGSFGLSVAGRFREPALAERFGQLARALRREVEATPPADLARLRGLAHVLRRSLKPRHDDQPPVLREEGSA